MQKSHSSQRSHTVAITKVYVFPGEEGQQEAYQPQRKKLPLNMRKGPDLIMQISLLKPWHGFL